MRKEVKEYKSSEISIQAAMVDMVKAHPDKSTRPDYIILDGQKVKTGHWIEVPNNFRIKLEFLSKPDLEQGADIKVESGFLRLSDERKVKLLRIWHDPKYESIVEYDGYSKTGRILVYNVYKEERAGIVFEEKWTHNAGMLVEPIAPQQIIFKCSAGRKRPPNYGSLVFKVTIYSRE